MKLTYLLGCAAALSLTVSMAPVSVAFADSGQSGTSCGGGSGGGGSGGGAGGSGGCTTGGTGTDSSQESFQILGTVNSYCVLGTFSDVDLGVIPINETGDTASLFHLTSELDKTGPNSTGGCNDGVIMQVSKKNTDGMENGTGVGYDSNVFQVNLPYAVTVSWQGPNAGQHTNTTQSVTVAANQQTNQSAASGAFIGGLTTSVAVPATTKGLVGGSYTDTVTVQLLVQ